MGKTFLHDVDCGDIIVSLASVKAHGGGDYYLKRSKPQIFPLLELLFNKQEFVGLHPFSNQTIDHDFSTFRKGGIPYGTSLGELHAKWVGIPTDFSQPWLTAEPSEKSRGKICVNRTARYNNPQFPWKWLVEQLGDRMIFVGLPQEWRAFSSRVGRVIEYVPTTNLWEVACLIAGSDLFIGNQSSPMAIAEGLKHPSIQETCLFVPDCIYPGPTIHCHDGNFRFELDGRTYKHESKPKIPKISLTTTPPGGYKVVINGREFQSYSIQELENRMMALLGRSNAPANLREMIISYTADNLPIEAIYSTEAEQMAKITKLVEQAKAFNGSQASSASLETAVRT